MYISLNWLKDFVHIPKKITPEELGEKLTSHTVEIDSVIKEADKYKNIVVGRILEVKPHPNADKLQLAVVDVKEETREMVCGAPNIKPGQLVPVALAGAVLPGGTEIKPVEIRGVESGGMLCAEDELGLGGDNTGILVLDGKAKPGQPFGEYLRLKDVVYEVDNKSITHRPDLWGHYGLAREIAAFSGGKTTRLFKALPEDEIKVDEEKIRIDIKIEDKKLCPRYMALAMDNITVKPSPEWLRERLVAAGLRPINNIVDVTNYVMLELGQPLHAFDARRLNPDFDREGSVRIGVAPAGRETEFTTLDSEKRRLPADTLLITDQKRPVAIAGVMGGENSEIGQSTKTIVLESANFDFVSIRRTAARLGLRTEAAKRFEKSLDPNLAKTALVRAAKLFKETDPGARIAGRPADAGEFGLNQGPVKVPLRWLDGYIGVELGENRIMNILESLGFGVIAKDGELAVSIPSWRATKDISLKEDIAEEVCRIYGYDSLAPKMPRIEMRSFRDYDLRCFTRDVKNILAGAGLSEVYNYSFVSGEQLAKMGVDTSRHLRLANPVNKEEELLRQSLATNLFANIRNNQARYGELGLFEAGSVFLPVKGGEPVGGESKDTLPLQEKRLAIAAAGEADTPVFDLAKGALEHLLDSYNLDFKYVALENAPSWAEAGLCAQVISRGATLGTVTKAGAAACRKCGVKKQTAVAEISLEELFKLARKQGRKQFREYAKYPALARDLAFVVSEKLLYNDIKEEISGFHEYIKTVELFDVYRGEKLGAGNKNLAFHIIYQADRTLTGEEVDIIQGKLIKYLEERFEAKIRDF